MQFELVTTYRTEEYVRTIMTAQELVDFDFLELAATPGVVAVSLAAL